MTLSLNNYLKVISLASLFSGRNIYEQSWSEGENPRRAETMAGRWLGLDHQAEAGNVSKEQSGHV